LDEDGGPAGPVAFVGQLFVALALERAGALLDGAIDVVLRHVDRARRIHRQPEAGIAVRVPATGARGDGDLPDDLGPCRGAPGISDRLLALDLLPFAVAGHGANSLSCGNL